MKKIVIIGYSGHSFVVIDIFKSMGHQVIGYCDIVEKKVNPYGLKYCGNESDQGFNLDPFNPDHVFIAIGDNSLRKKCFEALKNAPLITNAIHKYSVVSDSFKMGTGNMISAGVVVNSQSLIGSGCILNTNCTIEHEVSLGDFVHIAPGSVVCGNVKIGSNTLIGAGTVILPNLTIGENVVIGAGSVVTKNIPSN